VNLTSQIPSNTRNSPLVASLPFLLPAPRQVSLNDGMFNLTPGKLILLDSQNPQGQRSAAARLQKAMRNNLGFDWETAASPAAPAEILGLTFSVNPSLVNHPQGYLIEISPRGITAQSHDFPGLFYAVCTLVELIEQFGSCLPCLQICDWPDFPVRGVMLDISRDKVPTLATLLNLVDLLAGWKINQVQLYTEHTFAYRSHPVVWAAASPLTGQEIMELDAYCRERYIELVPNQNSFGHMHRWLAHPAYAHLAEVNDGFQAPWGFVEGPFSLCPTQPSSFEFITGLYEELLPHFSSRMVNVGCDETFDLGQGRSKEQCSHRGTGPVYLEFLTNIHHYLKDRGYTMQFWGDIVNQHPELLPFLPRDLIALEWGYENNHPFAENTARYAEAGVPFYVCPGTSSWTSLAGRTCNALDNLLSAAESGLKNGAIGYLITDWGDCGHWQFLPISYLGFAAGAAYAWSLETNRTLDISAALSRFAFKDQAGVMGSLAFELGRTYETTQIVWVNSSPLFSILQRSIEEIATHPKLRSIPYYKVIEHIEKAMSPFNQVSMDCLDHDLVRREFSLTARMMTHACERGLFALLASEESGQDGSTTRFSPGLAQIAWHLKRDLRDILDEYQALWLSRNKPGGLPDSLAWFNTALRDYETSPS
jgi:hexosaminidase